MNTAVYFLSDHTRTAVKIGFAANPLARIWQFQTAHPYPLVPLGTCPGGRALERELHAEFAADRLLGEWFRVSERLLERIKEICDDSALCAKQAKMIKRLAKNRGWVPAPAHSI